MSEVELESKFENIRLEEGPCKFKEEAKCDCKQNVMKPMLEHSTNTSGNSLKVKDKRKNLIKPSRLKMIGTCWARKIRNGGKAEEEATEVKKTQITFTTEAFLRLRIEPKENSQEQQPSSSTEEKDERISTTSQTCSAQAKLQQTFSSSEFDSTIEEMSEV